MKRSRRQEAERAAAQAWDSLVSSVESAGESARSAKRRAANMVDDASTRVTATTSEARRRANAAFDALAGRRPRKPWGWLLGAAVTGAVLGWLGNVLGRQAKSHSDTLVGSAGVADSEFDPTDTLGVSEPPLVERTPNTTSMAGQRSATTM